MHPRLESWLLRWAFAPCTRNPLRNLLRRIARRLLESDSDPAFRPGVVEPNIGGKVGGTWPEVSMPQVAVRFKPGPYDLALFRLPPETFTHAPMHTVEPPSQRPVDPDVEDWLREVTEPYTLWDSPKPEFYFPTEFFYDYVEPLPQSQMPAYVRPSVQSRARQDDPRREAFRSLAEYRALFTLSPDAVRSRTTR